MNLKQISANAQLKYEGKMSNMALLGTTLCATLYNENKEKGYVEALYFCAGDSRPYVIGDEVGGVECGGAAAGGADESRCGLLGDAQAYAVDDLLFIVRKADVPEFNIPP